MKQSFQYSIPPQDVDSSRRLRLYTLENYLLNVAGRAAEEQGYGIRQLFPLGYTWVITRLNLILSYLPTYYETITIETWIEQNAHMLSVRNYRIYLNDQLIGRAKSIWAVLDLQKREIVNAFDLPMFQHTVDGEPLDIPKSPTFHRPPSTVHCAPSTVHYAPSTVHCASSTILYSDCDYNLHCNSCKYLEHMLNAYLPQPLPLPLRLDINYHKEVHLNDTITTRVFISPSSTNPSSAPSSSTPSSSTHYQQLDQNNHIVCSALLTPFTP